MLVLVISIHAASQMDVSEQEYAGRRLIVADVFPSRYVFDKSSGAVVGWQISMADDSTRDVLFYDENFGTDSAGCRFLFNAASGQINNFEKIPIDRTTFSNFSVNDKCITFSTTCDSSENFCTRQCRQKVSYKLAELFFRVEVFLTNTSSSAIYWRPELFTAVDVPWSDGVSFEQHVVKSFAKKILKLSDSYTAVSSGRHTGKFALDILNDGAVGISQLHDSKIWVGTQNEEEGLSFIACSKTPQTVVSLKKLHNSKCLLVGIHSALKSSDSTSGSTTKRSQENAMIDVFQISPNSEDTFAAEISAY